MQSRIQENPMSHGIETAVYLKLTMPTRIVVKQSRSRQYKQKRYGNCILSESNCSQGSKYIVPASKITQAIDFIFFSLCNFSPWMLAKPNRTLVHSPGNHPKSLSASHEEAVHERAVQNSFPGCTITHIEFSIFLPMMAQDITTSAA
jgi:hypothetical protein